MITACWNGHEVPSRRCACPYCQHWFDIEDMKELARPSKEQAKELAEWVRKLRAEKGDGR